MPLCSQGAGGKLTLGDSLTKGALDLLRSAACCVPQSPTSRDDKCSSVEETPVKCFEQRYWPSAPLDWTGAVFGRTCETNGSYVLCFWEILAELNRKQELSIGIASPPDEI